MSTGKTSWVPSASLPKSGQTSWSRETALAEGGAARRHQSRLLLAYCWHWEPIPTECHLAEPPFPLSPRMDQAAAEDGTPDLGRPQCRPAA